MIIPPVFVFEGPYELHIFSSVRAAESCLEPEDVENEEYVAFDSTGHCIDLTVEKPPPGLLFRHRGKVVLSETTDHEAVPDQLRARLLTALGRLRKIESDAPLGLLITTAIDVFGIE